MKSARCTWNKSGHWSPYLIVTRACRCAVRKPVSMIVHVACCCVQLDCMVSVIPTRQQDLTTCASRRIVTAPSVVGLTTGPSQFKAHP